MIQINKFSPYLQLLTFYKVKTSQKKKSKNKVKNKLKEQKTK